MATTFKIVNGDVAMNTSSGRPKTIGNEIGNDDAGEAIAKTYQDLYRCLSLNSIRNRTTAGLQNLVGTVPQFGTSAIAVLVNRRIRDMFSAIIREQAKRPNIRPKSERFSRISVLRVFPIAGSKTSFRFRLDVKTINADIVKISGAAG